MRTVSDGKALQILNSIAHAWPDRGRWDQTDEIYVHRYGIEPVSVVGTWIDKCGGDVEALIDVDCDPAGALKIAGLKCSPLIETLLAEVQFREEKGAFWFNAVMHAKDKLLIRMADEVAL